MTSLASNHRVVTRSTCLCGSLAGKRRLDVVGKAAERPARGALVVAGAAQPRVERETYYPHFILEVSGIFHL